MRCFPSTLEPEADIAAQIAYMLDPAMGKEAVFVAEPLAAFGWIAKRWHREEGTLLTRNDSYFGRFAVAPEVSDAMLAEFLAYPCPKLEILTCETIIVAQIRNRDGHVCKEAIVSPDNGSLERFAHISPMPKGGDLIFLDPVTAQERRAALRGAA